MRLLVSIGHPAHVHLFKNTIRNLEKKGDEIKIVARDKDVTLSMLNNYKFDYELFPKYRSGLLGKAIDRLFVYNILYKISRDFKPDILIGCGGNDVAFVGKLINKPSVVFTDTEHVKFSNWITFPLATVICTPNCFKKNLGTKQIRYNGYHELAYLHPNYFKPDPSVLDDLGLSKDDKFIILRFVSWSASHDIDEKGFDLETKRRFVKELEKYGRIFITSEAEIGKAFEKYKIKVPPERIHDLLYYAMMYIGEGATMATEAGILGTLSIYISSLVGTMGNFEELEKKYGLVYSFRDPSLALEKALELLGNNNIKEKWQKKRKKLLDGKIDVTKFMTEFIKNYPESFNIMRGTPEYRRRFLWSN